MRNFHHNIISPCLAEQSLKICRVMKNEFAQSPTIRNDALDYLLLLFTIITIIVIEPNTTNNKI